MSADSKLRERVENVLLKYDAAKLRTVDTLISSFDSKEQQLMSALNRKYGPEPTEEEVVRLRREKGLPPTVLFGQREVAAAAAPPVVPVVAKQSPIPPVPSKSKFPSAPVKKASQGEHTDDNAQRPPPPLQSPGKQVPNAVPPAGGTPAKATPPMTPGRTPSPGSKLPSHPSTPGGASPSLLRAASPARAPSAKSTPDASRKSTPSRSSATSKMPTAKPPTVAADVPPSPPAVAAAPPPPKRSKSAAGAGKSKGTVAAPAVDASIAPSTRHDAHIQALTEIYAQHAPEKLPDVEKVLSNHANEIEELFQAIENKYQLPDGHIMRRVSALISAEAAAPAKKGPSSKTGKKSNNDGAQPPDAAPAVDSGAELPTLPSSPSFHSNKSVQEASRQLVAEVVEDFFQEHAPERVSQVPGLMQQYQDRQQDLFQALQQEFSKPSTHFKKLLSAKSKVAADALVKKGSYARGDAPAAAAPGAATAVQPSEQLWQSIALTQTPPAAAAPRVFTFREQLEYFCDKFCPMQSPMIDKALRVYHGRELELLQSLHAAYRVQGASEYLPAALPLAPPATTGSDHSIMRRGVEGASDATQPADAVAQPSMEKIPESMRPAAELARHFGLGPQFVPRVIAQYGREDPKRVMFEVLAAIFPDAMAHAFSTQEQQIAFTARRVATFLSYHHPSAKGAVGRIVAQYARGGKLDDALSDLLLRYYGSLLEAVPMKSFTPMDLTGSAALGQPALQGSASDAASLSRMMSAVDLQASPSRSLQDQLDSNVFSPSDVFSPDPSGQHGDVAAEILLRRREFKRSLDEWQQHYSGSSPFTRSTPRALGKMSETASSATTTADLPRDVKHASVLTFHREQEEARLLGMVERGMVTEPFNFNISSYQDAVDRGRRHFGGPTTDGGDGLSAMRNERHRELYGSQGRLLSDVYTGRTPIANPMIFLEDEDCSKCRVLKHQLDAATQRLHGIRTQQQYRDRLQKYEDMEQRAVEDAMLTSVRRNRGGGTVSTWMGGLECGSCKELQQQIQQLSNKLHCMRTRRTTATLEERDDDAGALDSPTRRRRGVHWNTQTPAGRSSQLPDQSKDVATLTDLDSVSFSDLRNYFILDAL